jgi:hypothetical protein
MRGVQIRERGWGGHFIAANSCRFRRNTLVTKGRRHIVVSTVGNMFTDRGGPETIGHDRLYETCAFIGQKDGAYTEADVTRQVSTSPMRWEISIAAHNEGRDTIDNTANDMHDAMVAFVARCFDRLYKKHSKRET